MRPNRVAALFRPCEAPITHSTSDADIRKRLAAEFKALRALILRDAPASSVHQRFLVGGVVYR